MLPFAKSSVPTDLEPLKAELCKLRQGWNDKVVIRSKEVRIIKRVAEAQQRVDVAITERDRHRQQRNDAISGIDDSADLANIGIATKAFDDAEASLLMRREEFRAVLDAKRSLEKQLTDLNQHVTECTLAIRHLSEELFKKSFSMDLSWKTGAVEDFNWRRAVLDGLLGQLPNENPHTIKALELFFEQASFHAIVCRGFQNISLMAGGKVEWSDVRGLVEVGPARQPKTFKKSQELKIPGDLGFPMAFSELLSGRLELVSA